VASSGQTAADKAQAMSTEGGAGSGECDRIVAKPPPSSTQVVVVVANSAAAASATDHMVEETPM